MSNKVKQLFSSVKQRLRHENKNEGTDASHISQSESPIQETGDLEPIAVEANPSRNHINQTSIQFAASNYHGLTLLYDGSTVSDASREREHVDGNHDQPQASDVDIIAIHGLNGHPLKSFTSLSTGCCWIKDFLPHDLPRCRIFTFGYESSLFGSSAAASHANFYDISRNLCESLLLELGDKPTRPLVFVAHSIGGLVVKRFLIETRQSLVFQGLFDSVSGILFFGTPHRGSAAASQLKTIARVTEIAGLGRVNKSLLHELAPSSETLQQINGDFIRHIAHALEVVSFYETQPSTIVRTFFVVDRDSAILAIPNEHTIALQATHANLCKYPTANEPNYKIVSSSIRRLCHRTFSTVARNAEILNESLSPFSPKPSNWSPNVVCKIGKTAMGLFEMTGSMEEPSDFSKANLDIIAVHGLGGHPWRSWINNSSQAMWVRDFLAVDFPEARIMSYGYKPEAAVQDSLVNLTTLASDLLDNVIQSRESLGHTIKRPLVFIGYSFGGLLIKKVLLLLKEKSQDKLLDAVAKVLFLGVPHMTDAGSQWTRIIQCTAGIKIFDTIDLPATISDIQVISEGFRNLKAVSAASVAESEITRIARSQDRSILVPVTSVGLGWDDRESIYVARNRNHLELAAFFDSQDSIYAFIQDIVANVVLNTTSESSAAGVFNTTEAEYFRLQGTFSKILDPTPESCDWIFKLPRVETWLEEPKGVLLIQGPRGCGKSVLAKYLVRNLPKHIVKSTVFHHFIDSTTQGQTRSLIFESLLHGFLHASWVPPEIYSRLVETSGELIPTDNIEGTLVQITKINSSSPKKGVIVIDGIDGLSPESDLVMFLNYMQHGLQLPCIITSRPMEQLRSLPPVLAVNWEQDFKTSALAFFVIEKLLQMDSTIVTPQLKASGFHIPSLSQEILAQAKCSFLSATLILSDLSRRIASGETKLQPIASWKGEHYVYQKLLIGYHEATTAEDWTIQTLGCIRGTHKSIIMAAKETLPVSPGKYVYQPLDGIRSIRMINLLPGNSEEPVRVSIYHKSLHGMPQCSAVSYEWGSSTRKHIIFCDGKELLVTANLFGLLKQFRALDQHGLLWIDAICINQDDLEERSAQVPLMKDIYRDAKVVLSWLGEEEENTGGAFRIMEKMAEEYDLILPKAKFEEANFGQYRRPSQIYRGRQLKALTKERSWSEILNIYSRTYFNRLWVSQEVVLSKNLTVLCGTHQISWEALFKSAFLILFCDFLRTEYFPTKLNNVRNLGLARERWPRSGAKTLSLSTLIIPFSNNTMVADSRDRVFGLLGMLQNDAQRSDIVVDYTKCTYQVYTEATTAIVRHEYHLQIWRFLNLSPNSREGNLPSWVPPYGLQTGLFLFKKSPILTFMTALPKPMSVQDDILTVYGFVYDCIVSSTGNISDTNLESCVKSQMETAPPLSRVLSLNEKMDSLWRALIAFDPLQDDYEKSKRGFRDLRYCWTRHPKKALFEEAKEYLEQVEIETVRQDHKLGRPIFQTQDGLFGIGPAGENDCNTSSVQVGDIVAVVARAENPVILRQREDGFYTLIGQTYIGCFEQSSFFEKGNLPDLIPFRIR